MDAQPASPRQSKRHLGERPRNTRVVTSPYLGQRRPSNQIHRPQDPASPVPRPPSPFPFSISPPLPSSLQSSPGSQYLSPPLVDSEGETLPYVPGPNDLISLDLHATRLHRKNSRRRGDSRSTTGDGYETRPRRLYSISEGLSGSTTVFGRVPSPSDDGDSEFEDTEETSLLASSNSIEVNESANAGPHKTSKASRNRYFRKDASSSALKNYPRGERLDRRSTIASPSERLRQGDFVPRSMAPIQSPTKAYARGYPARPSLKRMSMDQGVTPTSLYGGYAPQTYSFRIQGGRRLGTRYRRNDTPASITLRKASKQYKCDIVEPRVAALADYTDGISTIRPVNHSPNISAKPSGITTSSVRGLPNSAPLSVKQLLNGNSTPNIATTSDIITVPPVGLPEGLKLKRQRSGAEPALTIAEIHTSPRTFSLPCASHRHSSLAIDTMRKTSVVQIQSGGSVHEIIWAADDTPSSSTSQHTPGRSEHTSRSVSSTETKSGGSSPPATSPARHDTLRSETCPPVVPSFNDHHKTPVEMLEWSWDIQQPSSEEGAMSGHLANNQSVALENTQGRKRRPGRWSKKWAPYSDSNVSGIESFPPLLARLSTEQWQTKQPVDLNDPNPETQISLLAGDEASIQSEPIGTVNEGEEDFEMPKSPERSKSFKVGAGIGANSHVRRPSSSVYQQSPYGYMMDITRTLSRKASIIRQSLSGQPVSTDRANCRKESTVTERGLLLCPSAPCAHLTHSMGGIEALDVLTPERSIMPRGNSAKVQHYVSDSPDTAHNKLRLVQVAGEGDDEVKAGICKRCKAYGSAASVDWIC